ncbi:MAG: hypothetical protein ACYC99_00805, partial [Candidatus Geothermincolia bacterium]
EIPALSRETLERIGALLPDYWVPGNPVDLVAGLDLRVIQPIIELLIRSREVDSVLFIFIESQRTRGLQVEGSLTHGLELGALWDMMTGKLSGYVMELYGLAEEVGVPLYVTSNFDRVGGVEPGTLGGGSNPMVYLDVKSACTAIAAMARYHEFISL